MISSPWAWLAFLFGLVFGSFFNVCIFRLPKKRFLRPLLSSCPHCQAPVPFWLNIPIISFFVLRGKTRCCKKRLSAQYPIVELLAGIGCVFLFFKYPFIGFKGGHYVVIDDWLRRFVHAFLFASMLFVGSVIDLKHMIIPDRITIGLIVTSPIAVALHPHLKLTSSLFGVLIGGVSVYLLAWLYLGIRGREGVGMGDAKLLAGIGGWLGYEALWPTILYGSVLGSVIGLVVVACERSFNLQRALPFGPFLSLGALIHLTAPFNWIELFARMHLLF